MLSLVNARVFDGRRLLPGTYRVTVDGDKITEVSADPGAPSGEVIDVAGLTVLPGLITSHLHPDFYRFSFSTGTRPGKELPPGVMMAIGVRTCRVLLESGFTGYLGAACAHDIDAQLKMAIADDIISGPRIRACGHHLGTTGDTNNKWRWWQGYTSPGLDICDDGPEGMRKMVRQEISRGVETIKIFAGPGHGIPDKTSRNMTRAELDAIVETAHDRGAIVRAHVANKLMLLECIDAGVDILDHGDEIDDECIAGMVERGTSWVPSLVYLKCLLDIGIADSMDVSRELYNHVRETLPLAQQAGVRIMIGDDYSGIFRDMIEDDPLDHQVGNYGREFAYYGGFDGITPENVLAWGTSNPGHFLVDAPERVGVVEPGALADLIVVDGDPLTDLGLLARPQKTLRLLISNGVRLISRLDPRLDLAGSLA